MDVVGQARKLDGDKLGAPSSSGTLDDSSSPRPWVERQGREGEKEREGGGG